MALTSDERGKIYEDHAFLEGIYDSSIESNAVGDRVVDINPTEVLLKRLRQSEDSQNLPFRNHELKDFFEVDVLEPTTWGVLQPYTLLNELESEYAEILGYLRKIEMDELDNVTWLGAYACFMELFSAEWKYIRFMNEGTHEFKGLKRILQWVERLPDVLPVEISPYGLSSRSKRFSKAFAKKMGMSNPSVANYFGLYSDAKDFVACSSLFGQSPHELGVWYILYWNGTNTSITGLTNSGELALNKEITGEVAQQTKSDYETVYEYFQNVHHTQVVQAFDAFLGALYLERIEEAYKEALAYFDEVQREVFELAKMHVEAKRKAAQEEARKKRQAEEIAFIQKTWDEAEKIAKEEQRKKQIADEKERARLALIRDKQNGLLRKCKTNNMASRFCSLLEAQFKKSEFTCSWEDLLHRVWVPLGRPKNSEDWNVGIEWVLTSFSWTKSVEDLQKHIEHTMSTVVNPLISDQSVLLDLLPSDVKTFGRVVSFLEEKEFFNLQPEFFVGLLTRPEREFQHLKRVMIQLFDSSEDISSIDQILGRLLAGEDEAFVLADEGVAFQT